MLLALIFSSCLEKANSFEAAETYPDIYPDYIEVTIPSTIAPLNFSLTQEAEVVSVTINEGKPDKTGFKGKNNINFPEKIWRKMLEQHRGDSITITLTVQAGGKQIQYKPFPIFISNNEIDYGIVYRLIAPGYSIYSKMGIYERALGTYKEKPLFENTRVTRSCVNCHSFKAGDPSFLSMHLRGEHGGTVLQHPGSIEMLNLKTDETISAGVYPYWHPSGKYIAYSVNKTEQVFHTAEGKRIEVLDSASDIYVYCIETNQLIASPLLATSSFETFPTFSPDGKTLYFCSAEEKKAPEEYLQIKYSLCGIPFDAEQGLFGHTIDTLVSAAALNKSITFPRPSHDGKYLMFTVSDYGTFPIWHPEADLWMLDLRTNQLRELTEVNSDNTESYHSWSSNSCWFVFSSRRDDGLYTRPYIAGINDRGEISKPFMLPQKDPGTFYDRLIYSYNVPEFITASVSANPNEIEKLARKPDRKSPSLKP